MELARSTGQGKQRRAEDEREHQRGHPAEYIRVILCVIASSPLCGPERARARERSVCASISGANGLAIAAL